MCLTHPFHPLQGQDFEFVAYRHNWGEDRVHLHDEDGHLFSVPAGWTDVAAADPFVVIAAGRCGRPPPENADGTDGFADLKEIVVGPPGQAREEMQPQSAACALSARRSDVHSASCPCCLAGALVSSSRYRATPAPRRGAGRGHLGPGPVLRADRPGPHRPRAARRPDARPRRPVRQHHRDLQHRRDLAQRHPAAPPAAAGLARRDDLCDLLEEEQRR